jgi:hypothetical protein
MSQNTTLYIHWLHEWMCGYYITYICGISNLTRKNGFVNDLLPAMCSSQPSRQP